MASNKIRQACVTMRLTRLPKVRALVKMFLNRLVIHTRDILRNDIDQLGIDFFCHLFIECETDVPNMKSLPATLQKL